MICVREQVGNHNHLVIPYLGRLSSLPKEKNKDFLFPAIKLCALTNCLISDICSSLYHTQLNEFWLNKHLVIKTMWALGLNGGAL